MNSGVAVSTGSHNLHTARVALAAKLQFAGYRDKRDKRASQTAVRGNKEETIVYQVILAVQYQRAQMLEHVDTNSTQTIERLIDQDLGVQRAEEFKHDRDSRVAHELEAATREIVASTYVERIGEADTRPRPEGLPKYYEKRPTLFKDRRICSIQKLSVDVAPEQVQCPRNKLNPFKNISEFIEMLKTGDFKFPGGQSARVAEQLPLANLDSFAKVRVGQVMLNTSPNGVKVIVLASSRSQPVTLENTRRAIEQFLLNERKRELVTKGVEVMRDAANIHYVRKYAEGAASAASPVASALVPAPAPAASGGLSEDDINKGMGPKK